MFCPQCGTETKPAAKFCHACRHQLEAVSQPVATPQIHDPTPQIPLPQPILLADDSKAFHPWRRFFARTVDLVCLALPIYVVFYLALSKMFPDVASILLNPLVAAVLSYWLWVPVEAWFLATFGATPAKGLFGISVRATDSQKLAYADALRRTASVCIFGDAFGIPLLSLLTRGVAYKKLRDTGSTTWDVSAGSAVQHQPWGVGRMVSSVLAVTAASILLGFLNLLGKANLARDVFQRTPATVDSRPRPADQTAVTKKPSNEVETAEKQAEQERYYACLEAWPDKHPTEWKRYIKESVDSDGNRFESDFDFFERPDIRGCEGMFPKFIFPSGLSGWEEYRVCIRDWQEQNKIVWARFVKAETNGSLNRSVWRKIAAKRPDLKACENKMPRL